jgi:hypothetical protein|tara:strand:- start:4533 stop:5597 length:1065 start_codon:yes stop_codon:yes gene_type:complete
MFAQSSTFVVGAGASCELNLPSGDALMHKIASLLAPSKDNMYGFSSEVLCREIERLIPHTGVSQAETIRELKRAGQVIRAALPWSPSIDNLLHNHQDDEWVSKLGKAAIARAILDAETRSHFFSSFAMSLALDRSPARKDPSITGEDLQSSWYKPFAQLLFSQVLWNDLPKALEMHRFVIFNYDRCLEQFLFSAIQAHYNVSSEAAAEALENTMFVHPYGTLGRLPWQEDDGSSPLPLGDDPEFHSAFQIGQNLKTFTESVEDHVVFDVKQCIENATALVFLGFGYLKQNIELIRPKHRSATQVYATAYGLSSPNVEAARGILRYFMDGMGVEPNLDTGSCSDLFHNYRMKLSG